MNDNTWLNAVIIALENLGGNGNLQDIYREIEKNEAYKAKISNNKQWQASVRNNIERHSSDSDVFSGRKDLFFSLSGKGKGNWGLRNYTAEPSSMDITQDDCSYAEGKRVFKKHIVRERNQELIKKAKEKFKQEHSGKLFCEICTFDFFEYYGELGEDFIEAHHNKPISEMKDGEKTNINDIVMLCSNCHSMIHRKRPWVTKDELKFLLSKNTKK